jgi:hypothetical protein
MGAADRAEEYDDSINYGPLLLRGERLLLIKICGIFLDTGPGFCFTYYSTGEFRAVENDGPRAQCRFPGDWKRSEAVSALFRGMLCPQERGT